MNADDKIGYIYHREGNVEERPKILRVDVPAMFEDGGKLVQTPSSGVDDEHDFPTCKLAIVAVDHGHCEKDDEDDELDDFDEVAGSWDNEAVLVEHGCLSGVVQRDTAVLVVVGNDVEP